MNKTKIDTMIYEGLGFPIRLVNVPMKRIFGEWALDINFNQLQMGVLHLLATKSTSLSGAELRFIRHYFEMSTHTFAKHFGVSHVAVLKWEKESSQMNCATETWIRLYVLDHLKVTDKEFRKLYSQLTATTIRQEKTIPLEIAIDKIGC